MSRFFTNPDLSGLAGIGRMLNPMGDLLSGTRGIGEMMKPVGGLHDAIESTRAIGEMVKPAGGLVDAVEATRTMQNAMKPLGGLHDAFDATRGIDKALVVEATRGIDNALVREAHLLGRDPYKSILDAASVLQETTVSRSVGLATLNDIFRSVGGIYEARRVVESYKAARDDASSAFGASLADRWDHLAAASVLPTLNALSVERFDRPTALLSLLSGSPTLGSLSWLEPFADDGMSLRVLAFQSEQEAPRKLTIPARVKCALCKKTRVSRDVEMYLPSEGDLTIDLTLEVGLFCVECIALQAADPTYVERAWSRASLRLIRCEGRGGEPAGRDILRLVPRHAEDDTDE